MAESTIFPSPPDSTMVAAGKAYWIRYKHDDMAVVRLMANPVSVERTGMDDKKTTTIVYEETEFELQDKPGLEAFIRENFDQLWQIYEPCRYTPMNPVIV